MRKEISWVSPLRLGIIDAAVFAVMYLVVGILGLIFGGMMGGMGGGIEGAGMMGGGGIVALVIGVVVGAVARDNPRVIGAVKNKIPAGIVGGVVIELKDA
jgi:hypothetical protein